ncbi:MAB_1171c family putative transporter [Streptomyces olivaceiscleroticus]|uniref:MAB_1171c family putative transporter n=1 Tax=Streptomyces olivaceiscleroticus TaxID=68245 RepID=UPI003D154D58
MEDQRWTHLVSAEERSRARRRPRWEALPLAAAVLVLTVSTFATPAHVRGRDFATADMTQTPVALFFVAALLYLVYALASALWWTVRYARISLRPLATGLWLTAGALAGMTVANAGRLGLDVMRWHGEQASAWLTYGTQGLLGLVVPVFIVGVTYADVMMRMASARVWLQHRRAYRRLRPLWDILHEAFPQDALSRVPSNGWRDFLSLRGTHYPYYIKDGAVLVRGDRIAAVGPREQIERLAPEGLSVTAVPEGTLLPGLIDSHVHLTLDGGNDPIETARQTGDEALLEGMAERAQQLLYSGVTTVRDLADRNGLAIRLRDAIAKETIRGPRILFSATALTSPGSHLHYAKILDMVTTDAAQTLGITDAGQLAEGQLADLIAVDGDPLSDLGALRDIRIVVAGGKTVRS